MGNPRHNEARCFELIGYPAGWGTRGRARGRGRSNRGGRYSGGGRRGEAANLVTTNATTSGGAIGPNDASPGPTPVPGFTPEQVQRILSLIDNQKAGNEKLQGRIEWL